MQPSTASPQITQITDVAGFQALQPAWQSLFEQLPDATIFQSFDWHWHAWETICAPAGHQLRIIVVTCEGRVALIWPLMRDAAYLTMISPGGFQYGEVLVEAGPARDACLQAAWQRVKKSDGGVLLLQGVRATSRLGACAAAAPRVQCRVAQSFAVRISRFADWQEYAATLPKRLWADQARQWRRLERLPGPGRFEVVTNPAEIATAVGWMLDRKAAWLAARRQPTNLMESARYRAFLQAIALVANRRGWLFLSQLRTDSDRVSVLLGFRVGSQLSFYNFAYDDAWNAYSPGRLLLERSIQWCFGNDVAVFDFLTGTDSYKGLWASDSQAFSDYLIPLGLRGRGILLWHRLDLGRLSDNPIARAGYRAIPAGLRHRLRRTLQANAGAVKSTREEA